jgi:hypothetical protein
MKRHIALGCFSGFVAFVQSITAQEPSPSPTSVSPDKQWEYRCRDGLWSSIVNTGTDKMVLDLSNELEVPYCQDAQVVWASDSKRFAFNYSPPHAPHTSYETIALYQLRGDKWMALRLPLDETSERTQLSQLAKEHLPKSAYPRHAEPSRDILKVREWTAFDTAVLYAPCYGRTSGQLEAAFLFTLKFTDAGDGKIIKTRRMSKKELEEGQ